MDGTEEVTSDGMFHAAWLLARDVVEAGQRRLLIFVEIDESLSGTPGSALLALIDAAPQPRLLDLVDVGDDRENYLDAGPPLQIGPGSDLVLVSSAHLSAGADYVIRKALFADHDHFAIAASVFLQSFNTCGYGRVQTADFTVRPNPGVEFGSLQVAVVERASRVAADCDPASNRKAGVKTWRATFRWNPRKRGFETNSRELKALSKHNEEGL